MTFSDYVKAKRGFTPEELIGMSKEFTWYDLDVVIDFLKWSVKNG